MIGIEPSTSLPVLVNSRFVLGELDQPFQSRVPAKNSPLGFAASGLPLGTTIDARTGLISGVPASLGEHTVTLFATNLSGTSTSMLTFIVLNGPPPKLSNTNFVRAGLFQPFVFQLQPTNQLAVYSAARLPPGLSIDPQSGLISGFASQPGFFTVSLLASNKYGFATNSLSISVQTIVGWGNNSQQQLSVPIGLYDAMMLDAGVGHSICLRSDRSVVAWGDNSSGQTNAPAAATNVVAVSAGAAFCLALKNDGTVLAWGSNSDGQTNVPPGLRAVSISAGYYHSLAVTSNGQVTAWGRNFDGQATVPTGLSNVVAVSGGSQFSVALKSDGTVVAWGRNASGQTNVPVGLNNVVAISAGRTHALALKADGTVVGWGSILPPAGLSNIIQIAAGESQGLALKQDGTVVGWGNSSVLPTGIISNITAIVAGEHTLALIGNAAPQIVSFPKTLTAVSGATVFLNCQGVGGLPLSFQWMKNGGAISWETNRFLRIPAARRVDAGVYSVLVTNAFGFQVATNSSIGVTVRQKLHALTGIAELEMRFRDEDGNPMTPDLLSNFEIQGSMNVKNWFPIPVPLVITNGDILLRIALPPTNSYQLFRVVEH